MVFDIPADSAVPSNNFFRVLRSLLSNYGPFYANPERRGLFFLNFADTKLKHVRIQFEAMIVSYE